MTSPLRMRLVLPCIAVVAAVGGLVGCANIISFGVRELSVLECGLYLVQAIAAPVQLLVQRGSADSYLRPPDFLVGIAICALAGMPLHALYPRAVGAAGTLLGLFAWLFCILMLASQAT